MCCVALRCARHTFARVDHIGPDACSGVVVETREVRRRAGAAGRMIPNVACHVVHAINSLIERIIRVVGVVEPRDRQRAIRVDHYVQYSTCIVQYM